MTDIKINTLLNKLIEDAKKIGNMRSAQLTAEKFLVAVIDVISFPDKETVNPDVYKELFSLSVIVKDLIQDLNEAKYSLMSYITQDKSTTILDYIYIDKKLMEAYACLDGGDKKELDSLTLLSHIIREPSEAIESVLNKTKLLTEENSGKEDIDTCHVSDDNTEQLVKVDLKVNGLDKSLGFLEDSEIVGIEKKNFSNAVKSEMASLVTEVNHIRTELLNNVYGQDNAVNVFVTGYFQANMLSMIDKTRRRPRATFLFAGPPGVGKTLLAEEAAKVLKLPFKRFDMSEYSDKEAYLEFCGSDEVYKNAKVGNVTSFVSENPECVLLFDEIEKAHMCVINLFLQMLDAGRLRDNNTDEEVSFSDAIIILTTNAGKQLYEESESGDFSAVSRKVIIRSIQKDINPLTRAPFFPDAICSRFASGNVVMFNCIGAHDLREIARKEIEKQAENLKSETGISLCIDERVYTALLFSEGSEVDARTIRSRAETFFNDELYELLRLIASEKTKTGIGDIEKIEIGIDLNRAKPGIAELFDSSEKTKVLVFANKEDVERCRRAVPGFDFIGTQDERDAIEILKLQNIDFVLLDIICGVPVGSLFNLNIEDVESPARDFFKFIIEQRKELPVYLLEKHKKTLSEEEKISFMRQGVRGVLRITKGSSLFADQLGEIALGLHHQASMVKLAKENKLVSFGTSQTISKNGKKAEIKLFDFKMNVAVDSEDAKNILSSVSKPEVCFDDVIGAREAKKELKSFVDYLKNPKKYLGTGVKAPKGVILYGPSGTGKTLLAKALASESGVTFIAAEGNQFLKRFVGEGSEKVHELFKTARKYAPAVLFIDEIDAIAKERRGGANAGSNGEETLTAFLTEMDGFVNDPSRPVFVLAATNFEVEPGKDKSLDPALMRRFDRRVYIELPDREDRIRFLKMKTAENHALKISEDQIDNIAMRSTGMSLAELDSVIELSLRSAIREGSTSVNDSILEEAFETFNGGEVKKWDTSQLERVARHEAGHALLCWLSGETPSYLTVVARGTHGGYMQHAEQEGKAIYTKDELLDRIRTLLGGRASEIVYYGERDGVSTGASGDLVAATNIARQIVCTYGMDDDFGLAVVHGDVSANGAMSVEVRSFVNRILKEQMNEAIRLIYDNKERINSLVEELLFKNYLNEKEIESVLSN